MKLHTIFIYGMISLSLGTGQFVFSQDRRSSADSVFWSLSLPELQSYKSYYVQELETLQEKKRTLIQRGIKDAEHLLKMKPDSKVIDEILIRLADLYYYEAKDNYFILMESYDEQLIRYERGEIQEIMEEPRLDCSRSLNIYQRIIDEFPHSELVDDAIYNKAFIYEDMGQNNKANQIYLHLIDAYPRSKYVPEAFMRLGEYYFEPPVNDLYKAIGFYKEVLKYRDSPRYDEALYKIGWSYYRLSKYPEAVSYFTTLIEDLMATEKYDPLQFMDRADLRDETIEYIAISFLDFGGPTKAREYLAKIGNPEWGEDVLEKLGDVYMKEKEEYEKAIAAYGFLQELAPYSPEAPAIQKKIVDCYHILNDELNMFEARQKLFNVYKSDGIWWNKTKDEKAKLRAYKLTEQALRDNINTTTKKAEALSSESLHRKVVELGRIYLESFPEDLYSYMIRWNIALILDTKLHLYQEALQEYLTISLAYNSEQYEKFAREKALSSIRDAAENAIVVADTLVQREQRQSPTIVDAQTILERGKKRSQADREPIPLTTAESWLAMAYDNYIKHFPFEKNTEKILANAGALFYTHNKFTEALKYFKTLVKYFPKSEQVQNTQYAILESYFGKGDFESTEILAKRIISGNVSDDIKKKAEKRLGEAIFLKAQTLADAGKSSNAAEEFYRMALAAPTLEFADRAMFNAGREYEKIKQYESAIRVYELLRSSYSGSSLLPDVLNNLAFDYGEIGEYLKGADRYKTLVNILKEGERAKDALYNSWVFYSKAKNWQEAIEVGKSYALKYPSAEDASIVYFKVGEYYEKLDSSDSARKIYSSFVEQFSDSPLCIEAYFKVGKYYFDRNLLNEAEQVFNQTHLKNEEFRNRGIERNDYYAAEGLFFSTRILHDKFVQISFNEIKSDLNQAVSRKEKLLQQLVEQYKKVVTYKTHRLPESMCRIGEVYENFAKSWADQKIPSLDPTSKAVMEKEINERSTQIYTQALTSYLKAIEVLDRIIKETIQDEIQESSVSSSSSDSVAFLTRTWLLEAKEKVSEILYQMAEMNTESVEQLLKAPIPDDLTEIAELEYRSQVLIKAIKPILDLVIEAHYHNLQVADSLSLRNKWTEASRLKIIWTLTLLGKKYAELSFDALNKYQKMVQFFRENIFNKGGEVQKDLVNSIINLIDLSKSYSQGSIALYKSGVDRAKECGIEISEINQIQEEMIQFVLQMTDSLEMLIDIGLEDQYKAEDRFQKEEDFRFEEILAIFEDNVFFMNQNLKTILEETYKVEMGFENPSPSGKWIGIRLVKIDPNKYAERVGIPIEKINIPTDTTWLYTHVFQTGWEGLDFNTTDWFYPHKQVISDMSWDANGVFQITAICSTGGGNNLYVRKEIEIPGFPVSGEINFQTDSPYRLYFNGKLVAEEIDNSILSLSQHLKEGENLLALECLKREKFSIEGLASILYIPKRALPKTKG